MNDDQLLRYSRHILLDEIGIEAQERILASRMLVVGAGGLGSPAALYLAAAGVGTLMLADDDTVDLTNLQRQILHRQDRIGMAKTESARLTLASLNPDVQFVPLPRLDTDAALDAAVSQADVVLDGSDNFATRHAVNRACVRHGKPLVSGAAIWPSSTRASPPPPAITACFRTARTWKKCAARRWASSRRSPASSAPCRPARP